MRRLLLIGRRTQLALLVNQPPIMAVAQNVRRDELHQRHNATRSTTTTVASGTACADFPSACSNNAINVSNCFFTSGTRTRIDSPQLGHSADDAISDPFAAAMRSSTYALS